MSCTLEKESQLIFTKGLKYVLTPIVGEAQFYKSSKDFNHKESNWVMQGTLVTDIDYHNGKGQEN